MAKGYIFHYIKDWTKIDERDGFWGNVDLTRPDNNFGIHHFNNNLWTSGLVGVGRLFDRNNMPLQDNGKEHVLIVSSSYGLNPWPMLESVLLDDEYDSYVAELENSKKYLFKIFYDQPVLRLPRGAGAEAETLFALSYTSACYSLCKKGLKKTLIDHQANFTGKLRGKIDVNRNIKHNSAKGRNDRFYCKYIDFTEDNLENRIVKAALLKCRAIIRRRFQEDTTVRKKVAYCLNSLRHVQDVQIRNSDFSSAEISGLYSYYKPVLQQARAILGLRFQSYTDSEKEPIEKPIYSLPYVINMETLFEYYARTVLKKVFGNGGYRIEQYSKKLFVQKGVSNTDSVEKGIHLMAYCIPDIIIMHDNTPVAVIDAKYKPLGRPDREDSHQLLAYALLTGVKRCAFIMPNTDTRIRKMQSTSMDYLPLSSEELRYYELYLGDSCDNEGLRALLS